MTVQATQAIPRAAASTGARTSCGSDFGRACAGGTTAPGVSPRPATGWCGAVCKVRAPEAKVIPFSANTWYIRLRYSRCTQLGFTGRAVNLKRATTAFSVISAIPCSLSGKYHFGGDLGVLLHCQADLLGRPPNQLDIGAGFELKVEFDRREIAAQIGDRAELA